MAPLIAGSVLVESARNEEFFVGSDQEYSVNELAKMVWTAMGGEEGKMELVHHPKRHEGRVWRNNCLLIISAFCPAM